jgi:hypothetical protein
MRVAIALDDDVAEMINREMDRSGESFKRVVNQALRLSLKIEEQTALKKEEPKSPESRA